MNTAAVASFLKDKARPFHDFSAERLQTLAEGSRAESFEVNEAIVHLGAEATHFDVVLSGAIDAWALGDGGTRQSLGRLEAGDTFNEMALIIGASIRLIKARLGAPTAINAGLTCRDSQGSPNCSIVCSSSGKPTSSRVKPTMKKSLKIDYFAISANEPKNSAFNSRL
jgi:CRP-like cAMP-binding protein